MMSVGQQMKMRVIEVCAGRDGSDGRLTRLELELREKGFENEAELVRTALELHERSGRFLSRAYEALDLRCLRKEYNCQ